MKSIELGYTKKTVKDKDGKPKAIVEYHDSDLHDSGIKKMLQLGYGMYKVKMADDDDGKKRENGFYLLMLPTRIYSVYFILFFGSSFLLIDV